MPEPIHIISLGAGVQSSTMALMAAHGQITPMPVCAIFADTGAEPAAVYDYVRYVEQRVPFPVIRVSAGDLWRDSVVVRTTRDGERTYLQHSIPVFIRNADGTKGMARRHCTADYKIAPIRREVRRLGATKESPCVTWIGISTDEASRMRPSQDICQSHRWPLIEAGMNRQDCINWMERNGYERPPKSACVFCPYHSDDHWRGMSDDELQLAARYEQELQDAYAQVSALNGKPFLHRLRIPLRVALETAHDEKYGAGSTVDMFENECEGMCGV